MIDRLLYFLAPYLVPILIGATMAGLSWGVVQTWRLQTMQALLAEERADRAIERVALEKAARDMAELNVRTQVEHAARQQELVNAYRKELDAARTDAAAFAADAASLSDAVDCYASGRCLGPNANPAGPGDCSNRATTLGKLFREADAEAGFLAKQADRHAAEIRALKRQIEADRDACGAPNARN